MKFKVGDKVRLKNGLVVGQCYGGLTFVDQMAFEGEDTVISVDRDGDVHLQNGKGFFFTPAMLNLSNGFRYQIGDKVRVRADLERKTYYMADGVTGDVAIPSMVEWAGKVVTIKAYDDDKYRIEEVAFNWTDEMFEGLANEPSEPANAPKLKNGDKVRIRKDLKEAHYDNVYCTDAMAQHAGETVTVREVRTRGDGTVIFEVVEKLGGCEPDWLWSLGMTEQTIEEPEAPAEVIFDMSFIPTEPMVILPKTDDAFTKAWMESFVRRNGGVPVNG